MAVKRGMFGTVGLVMVVAGAFANPAAAGNRTDEGTTWSDKTCSYGEYHTITGRIDPGGTFDSTVNARAEYRCSQNDGDSWVVATLCYATKGAGEDGQSIGTCTETKKAYVNGRIGCYGWLTHWDGDGQTFTATCPSPTSSPPNVMIDAPVSVTVG